MKNHNAFMVLFYILGVITAILFDIYKKLSIMY